MSLILLILGIALLVAGAEGLVRGGSRLALLIRIPPAIVGLTLVSWGTSAPELVVSVTAAVNASTDMALGNVIGSSIANIGLVLGLAALLRPLPGDGQVGRSDYGFLVLSQLALPVMILDGVIGRIDGAALIALGLIYNGWLVVETRRKRADMDVAPKTRWPWPVYLLIALVGMGALAYGSDLFIDGAQQIARGLGVSDRVIGLTVVALGTSAPELATSVVAALRGQEDVSVGNVVGSNIFNTVFALGITAVVLPVPIAQGPGVYVDIAVCMLLTLALAPILLLRRGLTRPYAAALFASYVGYMVYLGLG